MNRLNCKNLILGGGISGLALGLVTKWPIFELTSVPGGICSSYYISQGNNKRFSQTPNNGRAYRFENGGGHWIFGADEIVLSFIRRYVRLKKYVRNSAVYFNKKNLYIPYPIQYNLRFLGNKTAMKVLEEISSKIEPPGTLKEWLRGNFGKSLCNLFFYPFHKLYTANLYEKIVPQDIYKLPADTQLIIQGIHDKISPVGYNVIFVYPVSGLNILVQHMAKKCNIYYEKKAVMIDVRKKEVYFSDGDVVSYERLISTLPLNKMIDITNIKVDAEPDPYVSVLALNTGAVRGNNCPDKHWLYIPDSKSGFYRVGFYSNVDSSFLPKSMQKSKSYVSIYVEKAYCGGNCSSREEIKEYSDTVIKELQSWGFIKAVEIIDPTWINVAYTWSWPESKWRRKAFNLLKMYDIYQLGRYGRWKFQGIAESLKESLEWRNSGLAYKIEN